MLLRVQGGIPLNGSVTLSGSKHSALAILGTILLMNGAVTLENFPAISDTHHMLKIIESLGVKTEQNGNSVKLTVDSLAFSDEEMWRVGQLRSSILFLGSILVRFGLVHLPKPGGDKLGKRPLDEFLHVFSKFNIPYLEMPDYVEAHLSQELKGHFNFDLCSDRLPEMGNNRTVLALILAWANHGKTQLHNALILPEIIETCHFLEEISNGFVTIDGVGTDTLIINSPGIKAIHANSVEGMHVIGPDKCEYAFWVAAASLTHGDILLQNPYQDRDFRNSMRWLRAKLLRPAEIEMRVLSYEKYQLRCKSKRAKAFDLASTAHELHGIAFDATPLFATILLNATGCGSFYCFKFKAERAKWIQGLEQIGARYQLLADGKLVVEGVSNLHAQRPVFLSGEDIRGASCVLLASLAASGHSIVFQGFEHILRGMENPLQKLQALGASIEAIE